MRCLKVTCLCAAVLGATVAGAATYEVRPDGTGDFPTIQAAIAASADGDIIELIDGTFTGPGNRDLDYSGSAITVRSRSGNPQACVLDCEGNEADPHRGFLFRSGEQAGSVLAGITITNGWMTADVEGGAILCTTGSSPRIQNCRFTANSHAAVRCVGSSPALDDCVFSQNHGQEGGAISCANSSMALDRCTFLDNTGGWSAGAYYGEESSPVFTSCVFIGNTGGAAGAVFVGCGGAPEFHDCLFRSNSGEQVGALELFCFVTGRIDGCTFLSNSGPLGGAVRSGKMSSISVSSSTFWGNAAPGSATIVGGEIDFSLHNCIIAFSTEGGAIECEGLVTLTCCDLYGNAGGDWEGCITDQYGIGGNICEDPLFCDPWSGDFTILSNSPCAPESNPDCGLIGDWPVGCSATPVEQTTWGAIKAMFRR